MLKKLMKKLKCFLKKKKQPRHPLFTNVLVTIITIVKLLLIYYNNAFVIFLILFVRFCNRQPLLLKLILIILKLILTLFFDLDL